MTTQQQEQRPNLSHERRSKRSSWTRWLITSIILLFVAVGAIIWILTSRSTFTTILPVVIFTVLGVLIALFQWLFPISSSPFEHSSAHPPAPQAPQKDSALHQIQPIIVQVPTGQPVSEPVQLPNKASYRGIVGFPPPTDQRTIQQREHVVREVYTQLTQTNITAVALTGIGGAGKSTLAALIYRYTEEQRMVHSSPFLSETLWLTVDPTVTFADLAGNLFEALDKPLPDLSNLAPQNQAVVLFSAMNTTNKPRLIIFDQFENLLNWETGRALTDRPGVGEWLDIINSQQCTCRILLTSRPHPVGTREYPPTYLQEYRVKGLEITEGVALLRNRGVNETEEELRAAVVRCEGHAFSLTLLASLMQTHHMNLTTLFKNLSLWTGDIAINLLDQIYKERLSDVQRELLLAFSVYRESVSFDEALAIVTRPLDAQAPVALKALLTQHLLEAVGEGRYQPHIIVATYTKSHIVEGNEQTNKETLKFVHTKAAQYYQQRAVSGYLAYKQRRRISDIHDLIEAIWHYCQAERWQDAYHLIEHNSVMPSIRFLKDNAQLLELYQLFLPLEKWNPESRQAADIYSYLAASCGNLERREEQKRYFEKALLIYQEIGDRRLEGVTLNNLCSVYMHLGNTGEALNYCEKALSIFKEVGERWGEAWALEHLGSIYARLGSSEEALKYFEGALNCYKELGDSEREASLLISIGEVYADLDEKEQAVKYFDQVLSISKKSGNRDNEGMGLFNIGMLYFKTKNYNIALAFFLLAKHIFEDVQNPDRKAAQEWIDTLHKAVGDEQFTALLATVEPHAQEIVDQALDNGLQFSD